MSDRESMRSEVGESVCQQRLRMSLMVLLGSERSMGRSVGVSESGLELG